MINLGTYNTLHIDRQTSVGFYLVDQESGQDVLFPNQYIRPGMNVGEDMTVFVYKDNEQRLVATSERPFITVGEFAYLEVTQVNNVGAFVDWGFRNKDLLVPFKKQANRMVEGKSYIVYLYEYEQS